MRRFHLKKNSDWLPTINLDQLHTLLTAEQMEGKEKPMVDLNQKGYFKLLGRGTLARPMAIKVRMVSDKAEARIKEAGGDLIITA
jgi:ribosomal protein L15